MLLRSILKTFCLEVKHSFLNKKCLENITKNIRLLSTQIIAPKEFDKKREYLDYHGSWPKKEQEQFVKDMLVIPNFITEEEERKLFEEVDPYMQRLRYEVDHWDDAIHGFRETERKHWYPHNREIIERIRSTAFSGDIMQYVHVLDLSEKGVIKPHVDSTRYCGATISGVSMLSDSVMRLVRTDEKKYQQPSSSNASSSQEQEDSYRHQPAQSENGNFYVDILLARRSLYIMRHTARYNFTHEILGNENSIFKGSPVLKTRRISIICRNEP